MAMLSHVRRGEKTRKIGKSLKFSELIIVRSPNGSRWVAGSIDWLTTIGRRRLSITNLGSLIMHCESPIMHCERWPRTKAPWVIWESNLSRRAKRGLHRATVMNKNEGRLICFLPPPLLASTVSACCRFKSTCLCPNFPSSLTGIHFFRRDRFDLPFRVAKRRKSRRKRRLRSLAKRRQRTNKDPLQMADSRRQFMHWLPDWAWMF